MRYQSAWNVGLKNIYNKKTIFVMIVCGKKVQTLWLHEYTKNMPQGYTKEARWRERKRQSRCTFTPKDGLIFFFFFIHLSYPYLFIYSPDSSEHLLIWLNLPLFSCPIYVIFFLALLYKMHAFIYPLLIFICGLFF